MTVSAAYVSTSETTTSTTYTDLATTTDSVTTTVMASGTVLVCLTSYLTNLNAIAAISYDVSGANTISSTDQKSLYFSQYPISENRQMLSGAFFLETGLSTGSTTFKMKYRTSSASNPATFSQRRITVIPMEDITTRTAVTAAVTTSQSTTSTTYTDLTTTTDTVTANIGPKGLALVFLNCGFTASASGIAPVAGYALSGTNTKSAEDNRAVFTNVRTGPTTDNFGAAFLETGLSAGNTTFKMKYRTTSGTSTFLNRRIAVIPL